MLYRERDRGCKGTEMTKMMDLSSTGLRRSSRSDNKPKQKYDIFHKLLLAVIVACEVTKNPHIFLSRVN